MRVNPNVTPPRRLALLLLLPAALAAAPVRADLPPKVLVALEDKRVRVRITAVVAVSKSGDKRARRILEGMLGDPDDGVRAAAAEGLERLGDPAARPALEKLRKDKSPLVRKMVDRALAALAAPAPDALAEPSAAAPDEAGVAPAPAAVPAGPRVTVEVTAVQDLSGALPEDVKRLLHDEVKAAIGKSPRIQATVVEKGATEGYALQLRVRSVKEAKQGEVSLLEVRCEMTLLALPQNALRLSSRATAGAGVEGSLHDALRAELLRDGVKACAPELAQDFVDYAATRAR